MPIKPILWNWSSSVVMPKPAKPTTAGLPTFSAASGTKTAAGSAASVEWMTCTVLRGVIGIMGSFVAA
jgi:hypothetical protein